MNTFEAFEDKEDRGLGENEFAKKQEELSQQTEHELLARQEEREHLGGVCYAMFPKGEAVNRQVVDFINNEYAKTYPVKAAIDTKRPEEGVKIEFNNEAGRNMEILLKILSQRGWQKTGEQIYFEKENDLPQAA